jgi:hypothetical protein
VKENRRVERRESREAGAERQEGRKYRNVGRLGDRRQDDER